MRLVQQRLQVVGNARPPHLCQTLLLCPQLGEDDVRSFCICHTLQFCIVQHITHQSVVVMLDFLHVNSYRMVGKDTDGSRPAMAHVEMNLRMPHNRRLSVLTIFKHRRFLNTILLAQPFAQQQVGCRTQAPAQLLLIAHHLLAPLVRQLRRHLLQVYFVNMVVDI